MDTRKVEVTRGELRSPFVNSRPDQGEASRYHRCRRRSPGRTATFANAAYDAARQDQAMIEKRIGELLNMLRNVGLAKPPGTNCVSKSAASSPSISMGKTRNTPSSARSKPSPARMISNESPVGRALIGKKAGDRAIVQTPGGQTALIIKAVR